MPVMEKAQSSSFQAGYRKYGSFFVDFPSQVGIREETENLWRKTVTSRGQNREKDWLHVVA